MYTREDFLNLDTMTQRELRKEITEAKQHYNEVQEYFNNIEQQEAEEGVLENARISVSLLTQQLGNIESYITKAEGLLDDNIGEVVLSLKTIKRRKKMMAKLSL